MAVRFVIGRAGSGKTRFCLDALVHALRQEPLGRPLFWIVPAQATFNTERLLVTDPRVRGSFRAQVVSFRRLTHLMAGELGIPHAGELDELARIVLLGDLVARQRGELTLFGPVADRPGFLQRLDAMLRELQQAAHTGESLRAIAAQLHSSPGASDTPAVSGDPLLPRKLADLALLLDAWDAALAERGLAAERLPQLVADRAAQSRLLPGARIWVDAFSALSTLEVQLLVALALHAAEVHITLLADPNAPAMRNPAAPLDPLALFHRTEHLHRMLQGTFARAGVEMLPPVVLTAPPARFAGSPELAYLERHLFSPDPPPAAGETPPERIELWQCGNSLTEVHAAAQAIRDLVAPRVPSPSPLRYRDIALVIPALEAYADAVRRIFDQHGIPHFIDQRRSITHHPLVEFLRSAVALAHGHYSTDDLCLLLKTGLTGLPDLQIHHLENYLLAHGITHHDLARPFTFLAPNRTEDDPGAPPTEAETAHLAMLNAARETLRGRLAPWLDAAATAGKSPPPGDLLTRALYGALAAFEIPQRMEELIAAAQKAADPELAMIHQQAWRQTVALLETLERILHERPTTLGDFADILAAALESLTLGLIPPTVDQVLVSSVSRSRHPEVQAVFILGAVESRFPLVRPEDPLLNDHQRAVFNRLASGPITPGSDLQLLDEQFFDYVAFTRAGRRLIVSRPLADARGKALVPSPYVARLQGLFPALTVRTIDPEELHDLARLATLDDALAATLRWARVRMAEPEGAGKTGDTAHAALYHWLATHADAAIAAAVDRVWPALAPREMPRLAPALAARFHPHELRMSVSQLEKFAGCPLSYFYTYTLGLSERPLLQLDTLQLGTLYHRILERVYDQVIVRELPWPECPQESLLPLLEEAVDQAALELHRELAEASPAYDKIRRRTRVMLGRVLEAQRRAACAGRLRSAATEVTFGLPPQPDAAGLTKLALGSLRITTPHGRAVRLNGKIDRLDIAGDMAVVIDYKSSPKKFLELSQVYHGLALQLPVYLLVVNAMGGQIARRLRLGGGNADGMEAVEGGEGGNLQPIGGFFVPLRQPRANADDLTDLPEPGSAAYFKHYKPRGLFEAGAIGVLDGGVDDQEVKKSEWYAYSRTGKGELSKKGVDAVEYGDFSLVLQFTRQKIARLIDELAEGRIAPEPYRDRQYTPCKYCVFGAMCPFDMVRGPFRELPKHSREEALEAMRREVQP